MTVLDPERFGEHMLASTITHRDTVWTLYGRFMNFIFKSVDFPCPPKCLREARPSGQDGTWQELQARRHLALDILGPSWTASFRCSWHLLASDRKGAEYLRNVEPVQKTSKNKLLIDGY